MNDKKIAFIICVNNEMYFKECQYYIKCLNVPIEYETEVFGIRKAASMCSAYNLGMQNTDAKYKIYMHQDVFIRNIDFLKDILLVFNSNQNIGMIGMIGGNGMPKSGMAYSAWNEGALDCCEPDMAYRLVCNPQKKENVIVEAVDGLLMATQYDILWREDLFQDFDFYDISHSFEMRKAGYKVVVPYQEKPWVFHDSSFAKLSRYEKNRKIALKEYSDYFYFEDKVENRYAGEWERLADQLAVCAKSMIESNRWEDVSLIIDEYRKGNYKHSDLETIGNLVEIYNNEKNNGSKVSFFEGLSTWQDIYEKYKNLCFMLRRCESNSNKEAYKGLREILHKKHVAIEAIFVVILHSTIDKKMILAQLEMICKEDGLKEEKMAVEYLYRTIRDKKMPIAYTCRSSLKNM